MLDGIPFSEKEFYQQQDEHDRRWGRAINFAIVFHAVIFIGAFYLPDLFDPKPLLDEVMTIDLVSLPQPVEIITKSSPPAAEHKAQPQPEPEPEKAVAVEPVRLAPEPEPAPVVKARPISVRPLKRKIKKARDTRLVEEKQRQQRAEKLKRQAERLKRQELERKRAVAQARTLEKRADDEARRARAEVAALYREKEATPSITRRFSGPTSRSKQVNSTLEKQYQANLSSHVQRLWILPEIKKWSPTLETIIEFTVLRDGRLVNVQIAKSSGDTFFDRFAKETVKKAAPMPPFPAALRKNRMDLGIRLRPAGIQH